MNKLLGNAIDAHGGLNRWQQFVTIECDVIPGGKLHDLKRNPPPNGPIRFTAKTSEDMVSAMIPGGGGKPDLRSIFRPDRVTIETLAGKVVAERNDPRSSFADHGLDTPWDPLHRLYFSSYAMWMYLTTPFTLGVEGAQVWDIDPIEEGGETWRGIRVAMPSRFATHSWSQEYYFGPDMLLRRQDYTVDIIGGLRVANYAIETIDVNGLKLASKRRAYMRDKKSDVLRDMLMISLDFSNMKASERREAIF